MRSRPYLAWKVLFRRVSRPVSLMAGRTDGEAGNRTSYSPVGAGTGAELGKNMKGISEITVDIKGALWSIYK